MAYRELISRNLGIKCVALILATLVWLMLDSGIEGRLRPSITRTFPRLQITVMSSAADDRVFRVEPNRAEVTLSGPADLVQGLRPSDIEAYVNLTTVLEAKALRKRLQVYTPPGVTVGRVTPAEVVVQVLPLSPPPAPAKSR
jgi:YbbR domain-containing protein